MDKLYDEYTHRMIKLFAMHQLNLRQKKTQVTEDDAMGFFGNVQSLLRDFVSQLDQLGKNKVGMFIKQTSDALEKLNRDLKS